jgi:predicted phosphodiesterase
MATEVPFYHNKKKLAKALKDAGDDWHALSAQCGTSVRTLREWGRTLGVVVTPKEGDAPPGITPIARIGSSVTREEALEAENVELRTQVRNARKLEVFDEKALRLLEENVLAIDTDYVPLDLPVDTTLTPHTHVLQWSDLHASEVVSSAAMNGLNEYNWDIMEARHHVLAGAIRSFKRNRPYPIDDLYILGLGDMVTGDIHDELRETNDRIITESAVKLGYFMADFVLSELLPLYKRINISAVVGNHGRTSRKPEFKNANKNWDWIAYKIMELRLAEFPEISVSLPDGYEQVVTVYDKNILLFHGDGVPTNMPGVPWGGITRHTREKADTYAKLGTPIHHFACGHYHEANVVNQKRILMNGSIKGPDEYSLKRFGGGQPPCQLLHTFHPTRGLVGTDYLVL